MTLIRSVDGDGSARDLKRAPRRFSRFRLSFFARLQRAAVALGGRRFYRWSQLRAGRFNVRREVLSLSAADSRFDGLRIVHWTDLHAGPFLGAGDLRDVVRATMREQPDVILLTGDYITDRTEQAFDLCADLSDLRARLGIYAVFGNHDYKARREDEIAERFGRAAGVVFLRNRGVRVPLAADVDPAEPALFISGVEDVEEGRRVDIEAARSSWRPGDVELCLCHNPLAATELARESCAAVFSGHTHGHQINLHLIRRLAPKHPGGRRQSGATALICSVGLGALGVPARVRARAEIVVVELRTKSVGATDRREVLRAS